MKKNFSSNRFKLLYIVKNNNIIWKKIYNFVILVTKKLVSLKGERFPALL